MIEGIFEGLMIPLIARINERKNVSGHKIKREIKMHSSFEYFSRRILFLWTNSARVRLPEQEDTGQEAWLSSDPSRQSSLRNNAASRGYGRFHRSGDKGRFRGLSWPRRRSEPRLSQKWAPFSTFVIFSEEKEVFYVIKIQSCLGTERKNVKKRAVRYVQAKQVSWISSVSSVPSPSRISSLEGLFSGSVFDGQNLLWDR